MGSAVVFRLADLALSFVVVSVTTTFYVVWQGDSPKMGNVHSTRA
jgi:hypothetical protein